MSFTAAFLRLVGRLLTLALPSPSDRSSVSFGNSGAMLIEIPYLFRAYNFKNEHFPIAWSRVPYRARLLLPHEWGAK